MSIYFIVYHVKPLSGIESLTGIGGAYVSCWIRGNSLEQAIKIAGEEIVKLAKWRILEIDEAHEIKEEHYKKNAKGLEFYNQVLIDNWVLRFHTYPVDNNK